MRLAEYIKDTVVLDKNLQVVSFLAKELEIPAHIIESVIVSEAFPCNARPWPHTWLQSGKRVDTFINGLQDQYLASFSFCTLEAVSSTIDTWNQLATAPQAKLNRLFECTKVVCLNKSYTRSKDLKDFFVLTFILTREKGLKIEDLIRYTLDKIKDGKVNFTARVLWKWSWYMKAKQGKSAKVSHEEQGLVKSYGED